MPLLRILFKCCWLQRVGHGVLCRYCEDREARGTQSSSTSFSPVLWWQPNSLSRAKDRQTTEGIFRDGDFPNTTAAAAESSALWKMTAVHTLFVLFLFRCWVWRYVHLAREGGSDFTFGVLRACRGVYVVIESIEQIR